MNLKIDRINRLIQRYAGDIILKELSLKEGVFITIVKVDTSPDFRYTKVFISVFPEKETDYALKTLGKELYNIQGDLNRKLHSKPLPRISFHLDTTERKADEIEKLLKEI